MAELLFAALSLVVDRHLQRFPDHEMVSAQRQLCAEHVERLRFLRNLYGWSDGFWDDCLSGTRQDLRYWQLLEDVQTCGQGFGPVWQMRRLEQLRRQIGDEHYRTGWHPPLVPDCRSNP